MLYSVDFDILGGMWAHSYVDQILILIIAVNVYMSTYGMFLH